MNDLENIHDLPELSQCQMSEQLCSDLATPLAPH